MGTITRRASRRGSKAQERKQESEAEQSATEARKERDAKLTERVVEMREGDEPSTWAEIGEELGITAGKAAFLKMCADVKPKDRIKGTDEQVADGIVNARDELDLSWGQIAARAAVPESRVKAIYEDATGKDTKGLRQAKRNGGEATQAKAKGKSARAGRRATVARRRPSSQA